MRCPPPGNVGYAFEASGIGGMGDMAVLLVVLGHYKKSPFCQLL